MASPVHIALLAILHLVAFTNAGPLGPMPNITSADIGIKEGTCALGDVVYLPGDEFPGSSPCEKCACTERGVHCTQQQCEPRPGCKALHRSDHCCPTYQCECEQEGRVYGNGEKLVDPADPCRVCYCQGGEVVCRRIACFLRDDCTPRLVPGRCCPEYDNCPLRGVTALPSLTSAVPVSTAELIEASAAPTAPKEVKQEITIKEITPVSEIPIITDVKIKEILPSPGIDVAEYSSSKSPLIPREATSEKNIKPDTEPTKREPEVASPSVVEIHTSPETTSSEVVKTTSDNKAVDDAPPSKISLSTQDSINSDIYPSNVPVVAIGSSPTSVDVKPVVSTTKIPMIEEEDPSLFDHNPAFPPLPDDLSVLSSHGDEFVPETSGDTEHDPMEHVPPPDVIVASISQSTETEIKVLLTTTPKYLPDTSIATTEGMSELSSELSTAKFESTTFNVPSGKEIPVINLRSAIPTEILTSEAALGRHDFSDTTTSKVETSSIPTTTTEVPVSSSVTESFTKADLSSVNVAFITTSPTNEIQTTTFKATEPTSMETSSKTPQQQTTNSIAKSNVPTEVTTQTELSSLPIETSDQNPHDASENVSKDALDEVSTADPITTVDKMSSSNAEVITVSKAAEPGAVDNVETTEFILTSFGSSESATDAVELIKIASDKADTENHAAIIDNTESNKNALSDLIKLVSDVASIGDHTAATIATHQPSSISDSEELIPVNAGYKSKSNYNQNSITEIPLKTKNMTPANKQKVVEIEDDESAGITDSPPPYDKVEPTTKRPIIDNVSDDQHEVKTDKKDIEIITQSYVPTINRRPTKVVLKEDKLDELPQEDAPVLSSVETATEFSVSSEAVTGTSVELTTWEERRENATFSAEQ